VSVAYGPRWLGAPFLKTPPVLAQKSLSGIIDFCMTRESDPEFEAVNPRPLGIPVQKLLSLVATGLVVVAVITAVATK
jgi:hypothetical protein